MHSFRFVADATWFYCCVFRNIVSPCSLNRPGHSGFVLAFLPLPLSVVITGLIIPRRLTTCILLIYLWQLKA